MSITKRGVAVATRSMGPLPPTQLLIRNIDRVRGENILLAGVPRDEAVLSAFGGRRGTVLAFDYGAHLLNLRLLAGRGESPARPATQPGVRR